jgi:hypothetical protein
MKPEVLKTLIAARELIADPAHWLQGAMARNGRGEPVDARAPVACRWCAMGAIRKEAPDDVTRGMATRAVNIKAESMGFWSIVNVNDAYTFRPGKLRDQAHAATLMVFDLAIGEALK